MNNYFTMQRSAQDQLVYNKINITTWLQWQRMNMVVHSTERRNDDVEYFGASARPTPSSDYMNNDVITLMYSMIRSCWRRHSNALSSRQQASKIITSILLLVLDTTNNWTNRSTEVQVHKTRTRGV